MQKKHIIMSVIALVVVITVVLGLVLNSRASKKQMASINDALTASANNAKPPSTNNIVNCVDPDAGEGYQGNGTNRKTTVTTYKKQGQGTAVAGTGTDACKPDLYQGVTEYICYNGQLYAGSGSCYTTGGCVDGACVGDPVPQPTNTSSS